MLNCQMAVFLKHIDQNYHSKMARKEKSKKKSSKEVKDAGTNGKEQVVDTKDQELEPAKELTCEERYAELNNKYIRLYSDFDNYRKRTIKEKGELIASAGGEVILVLLEVLDDFERAILNNENIEEVDKLKEGFELIYNKMNHVLQAQGLEPMNANGDVFDPDKHEAISNIPVDKKADKGKVVDVIERGYNLKGKPLRYAKVVVGQ